MSRAHRRWSRSERAFVAKNIDTMTNAQIGAALGRSAKSVEGLCWRCGITRTTEGRKRSWREAGPRISAGKRPRSYGSEVGASG